MGQEEEGGKKVGQGCKALSGRSTPSVSVASAGLGEVVTPVPALTDTSHVSLPAQHSVTWSPISQPSQILTQMPATDTRCSSLCLSRRRETR